MSKKPFEPLSLVPDSYDEIKAYIDAHQDLANIANTTMNFLSGFYSDFGLELLSSVDYILSAFGTELSNEEIYEHLKSWTSRKAALFSNIQYIDIARKHILALNRNLPA